MKVHLPCRTLSNGKLCGRFNLCAHLLSLRRITIANELNFAFGHERNHQEYADVINSTSVNLVLLYHFCLTLNLFLFRLVGIVY